MTKVNIPAPPRKSRLPIQAQTLEAPDHLSKPSDTGSTAFVDMNFKVDPKFHRRFKAEATLRSLSMKELLEVCFKAYLAQNGGSMNKFSWELIENRDPES